MGGADGIASHFLHGLDLADEGSLVFGGSERTEVVVEANSLNLARDAIELESTFLRYAYSAYAEACYLLVEHLFVAFLGG